MANSKFIPVIVAGLMVTSIFAFNVLTEGSIKGTIMPADGASRAWALSPTDTLRASIINGAYQIKVAKPGTYRVIIEAKPPFKNAAKDSVMVLDGQTAEVGEIKLEQ